VPAASVQGNESLAVFLLQSALNNEKRKTKNEKPF